MEWVPGYALAAVPGGDFSDKSAPRTAQRAEYSDNNSEISFLSGLIYHIGMS